MIIGLIYGLLTHLPQDKMAAVWQTIFSNAFSWMKSFVFWLKFLWSLVPRVQWTKKTIIGLNNGLAPNRRQVIIWTNADPIHWRIHTTLGGDEFNKRLTHGVYRHAKTNPPTTKNGCRLPDTIVNLMAKTPRWIIVNFTIWNQHQ